MGIDESTLPDVYHEIVDRNTKHYTIKYTVYASRNVKKKANNNKGFCNNRPAFSKLIALRIDVYRVLPIYLKNEITFVVFVIFNSFFFLLINKVTDINKKNNFLTTSLMFYYLIFLFLKW